MTTETLDVQAVRRHFAFPERGRIVTNNAASTQPPRELLELYASLSAGYENVHRGQSSASQQMTGLFEESYDTFARFVGAPGQYRVVPEHHRGDQRGHVLAADRVR
jgi:cysteine desulfurase/selenocysteine lyase